MHIQTYDWTIFALCESTLTGGLQAEAMARIRNFSKNYTHSNIQMNNICALWMYSEWWASSRSNGFGDKFFKTLYTLKHTTEQSLRSVEVHWVVGFKQKQLLSGETCQNILNIQTYNWKNYALYESTLTGGLQAEAMAFRRTFSKHYTHSNIQFNKICALRKYTEGWASRKSNGFQKIFFKTLYTFKHTIEQNICSVKVHCVAGSKQKQWFSETLFQSIRHIQTYKWMKYALCESTLSGGLQAEAMAFRRSFSKHYTHSNLQMIKVCALWKYSECWASSRSNGFQTKFFETLYTFQKDNWTNNALCESTLRCGLQAEAMAFRSSFLKHYTHSNIQLKKVCALWKYSERWTSIRSNGFPKKFFNTLYTFKHTIEQNMRSVDVYWLVGFKQKQWLA